MIWRKGQSAEKPETINHENGTYIVRRNITTTEATDETPQMYDYEVAKMTEQEFLAYVGQQSQTVSEDNLTIMEAIADLYEAIAELGVE